MGVISDRDIRVVESMFQSGMDKETVISLFPQFAREDVEEIGKKLGKIKSDSDADTGATISINCS